MPIDRGPWNALIDDDGSNLVGTVWNKDKIKTVILDPSDLAIAALGATITPWIPSDFSGAGLSLGVTAANYSRIGRLVFIWAHVTYPVQSAAQPALIAGLPFVNSAQIGGLYQTYGPPTTFHLSSGFSYLTLLNPATMANHTNATLSGSQLIFNGVYIAP
jgi:hypothetical protein